MTHRTVRALLVISLALCSAWIGAGCVPPGMESSQPTPTALAAAAGAPTSAPAVAPSEAAVEAYRRIAPSLAMVEIPTGTGSGIVIAGSYVLTNAHVVWPYDDARVVLPDGSAWDAAPVAAWDLLVDLALIGPLETGAAPLEFAVGEDLAVGSSVYLLGYPGEVDRYPQPAIAGGMISRTRQWEGMDISYFQVDATIAGGQSGGALVSADGRVIGVSGFMFANAYGLVASAADLAPHVERLLAEAQDPANRRAWLPREEALTRQSLLLGNLWDTQMYVLSEPPGTAVECEVDGANDAFLLLADPYGEVLVSVDDYYSGPEVGSATLESVGDHFVIVGQSAESPGRYRLRCSHPVTAYQDPLDGQPLAIGETIAGVIEYPWDMDFYLLELEAGQTVDILVDSAMIDPYLTVDFIGASEAEVAVNDDGGGGLFGLNARLIYTAPHRGDYFVIVEDAEYEVGGYLLTVTDITP